MDQQAARGAIPDPHTTRVLWPDWHRTSVNRLASTVLLTGGITPITAAALIGGISWTRWLVLMCVPYYAILAAGAALIYGLYGCGFGAVLSVPQREAQGTLSGRELRTALITIGASALWLTDALHHLHPTIPALLAWICLLAPGIGVLSWTDFERHLGWANLFVLASSLSLAMPSFTIRRKAPPPWWPMSAATSAGRRSFASASG
jgi:hypothetical protein